MSDKPRSILERDWPYPGDIDTITIPCTQHEALMVEIQSLRDDLIDANQRGQEAEAIMTDIAALAQENERIRWDRGQRIRELEAERDDYKSMAVSNSIDRHYTYMEWKGRAEKAEAERDAITSELAKMTIDASGQQVRAEVAEAERDAIRAKIAKLCDGYTRPTEYASDAVKDIADAIRTLAQTDESKTESGK